MTHILSSDDSFLVTGGIHPSYHFTGMKPNTFPGFNEALNPSNGLSDWFSIPCGSTVVVRGDVRWVRHSKTFMQSQKRNISLLLVQLWAQQDVMWFTMNLNDGLTH